MGNTLENSLQKIVALAPMDGITNCAYRTIVKEQFHQHNTDPHASLRMWTEFMNVEGFMREPGRLIHHMIKTDYETNTVAQIYGADHHDLVETARYIDSHMGHTCGHTQIGPQGFTGIELNIGCPSPKVMSCGGGAGMLRDRPRTMAIIRDIASSCALPFSIKTRAGLTQEDKEEQRAFIVEAAPFCQHIVIHGRTYKQSHTGDVDWDFIYSIKRELGEKCIIIGNGGIQSHDSMIDHFTHTTATTSSGVLSDTITLDGIMVGQAAIGRPWILTGHEPTLDERLGVIIRHCRMMVILHEYYCQHRERGRDRIQPRYDWLCEMIQTFQASTYNHPKTLMEFRKYLFTYISGLPHNRDIKQQLAHSTDYDTMIGIIETYFARLELEKFAF